MTDFYTEEDREDVDWEAVGRRNPAYYSARDLLGEVIAVEVDGEILTPGGDE